MGVVYLAYCGSWQLSLHVPCFCAFYIFNTTPNPTFSSMFLYLFTVIFFKRECMYVCACMHACAYMYVSVCMSLL